MRGAEVAIAHVIIAALAVALAAAAATWFVLTSKSAMSKTVIKLYPDSYIKVEDRDYALRKTPSLHLHLSVEGPGADVEYIEVIETGDVVTKFYLVGKDVSLFDAYRVSGGAVSSRLPGGWEGWLIADLDMGYVAGNVYTVRVYLVDGSFYDIIVFARG